jgi:hypothetical protein
MLPNLGERSGEALCERHTATRDANEDDGNTRIVAFGDFVGDAREGAADGVGIEDLGGVRHGGDKAKGKGQRAKRKPAPEESSGGGRVF